MARTAGQNRRRREEVIETAAQVFHRKGYEAATIQDIAEELGILKGSLYYYISTKEEVLFEIVRSYHEETRGYFDEIIASQLGVVDKLRRFVATETAHTATHLVKSSLFFTEWRGLTPEHQAVIVAERDRHDQFVQDCIRQGQEEGVFRQDIEPRVTSFGILGMTNSVYRWYQAGGPATAAEVGETFADFVIRGLRA
ncbi:TetR family transcriptional regulator [Streptomyces sp. NPDC004838]